MFEFCKLIILSVLIVALKCNFEKEDEANFVKYLDSFKTSLEYIIMARKAPGEMSITPNTLRCLMTAPFGFRKSCLAAYQDRLRQLGLKYDAPDKEEELGKIAFLALEDICKKSIENITKPLSAISLASKELKSLLIRGDILCFISYVGLPSINPNQLAIEINRMTNKNGFMTEDEAKLQILLNHYNLLPDKCHRKYPTQSTSLKTSGNNNVVAPIVAFNDKKPISKSMGDIETMGKSLGNIETMRSSESMVQSSTIQKRLGQSSFCNDLESFIKSLDYNITVGKAPGQITITPITLDYLKTSPMEFRWACLNAYNDRLNSIGLVSNTSNNEEKMGRIAFLALEEVCNKTVENLLMTIPKDGKTAVELNTVLTRGDILSFFSFMNNPSITEDQLDAKMSELKAKNGFMSDEEARLGTLLNQYNLKPNESSPLERPRKEIQNGCIRFFAKCFNLSDDC